MTPPISAPLTETLQDLGQALSYRGPERRRSASEFMARLLASVLDEVDYGLILLAADGKVLHVNQAARQDLGSQHPLLVDDKRLRTRATADQQLLQDALTAAQRRSVRAMIDVGRAPHRIGVSLTPLPMALSPVDGGHAVLVTLQRSQLVEILSVGAFARSHGLSPREEEVLGALCQGLKPAAIAESLGISGGTVRTHIHNLKEKTNSRSMVDLFKQVAVLPPLVSALRT